MTRERHLGAQLRAARTRAGLTQHRVASISGLTLPTIRLAERGAGYLGTFGKLCHASWVSLDSPELPGTGCVGSNLGNLRIRRGISRGEVSRSAGLALASLARLEQGLDVRLVSLVTYADSLGATLRLRAGGAKASHRAGRGNRVTRR